MIRTANEPRAASNNRPQILIRDRLDNIPTVIKHLDVTATRVRALLRVIQSVLASVLAAVNRANAFGFEDFPTTLFLPSRVA
jgi:hypothetical protein